MNQCQHVKNDGYQCSRSLRNKNFCWQHQNDSENKVFYFFYNNGIDMYGPNQQFLKLMKNSSEKEFVGIYYDLINYDGYNIRIDRLNDGHEVNREFLKEDYILPKYGEKLSCDREFVSKITKKINYLLKGILANQWKIDLYRVERMIYDVSLGIDFSIKSGSWFSCLKDKNTDLIIGVCRGIVLIDQKLRPYSYFSYIGIHPNNRDQSLCQDFAKHTYWEIIKKWGVKYFIINNQFYPWPPYRYYIGGALDCGFRCFIDKKEIFGKDFLIYLRPTFPLLLSITPPNTFQIIVNLKVDWSWTGLLTQ